VGLLDLAIISSRFDTCHGIKILLLNIRSLRENFDEFLLVLDSMRVKPHIIVLTEIWIYESETTLYDIENFMSFFCCNDRSRSDGVAVYVNNALSATVATTSLSHCSYISLEITGSALSISLTAIYRSPSLSLPAFLTDLEGFLLRQAQKKVHVILGDININTLEESLLECVSSDVHRYLELLAACGYEDCVEGPTREVIRRNHANGDAIIQKSKVDHVLLRTFSPTQVHSKVLKWGISDHYAVKTVLQGEPNRRENTTTKTIKIKHSLFVHKILNSNFQAVLHCTNPENAARELLNIIGSAKQFAQYEQSGRAKTRQLKPWMTSGLLRSIRYRDNLKKKKLEGPTTKH
jgi:hypothetical protein